MIGVGLIVLGQCVGPVFRDSESVQAPTPTATAIKLTRADLERAVASLPLNYRSSDGALFGRPDKFEENDGDWTFFRQYAIPAGTLDEEFRLLVRQVNRDLALANWDSGPFAEPDTDPMLGLDQEYGQFWERGNAQALVLIASYPLGSPEFPEWFGYPTIEITIHIRSKQ